LRFGSVLHDEIRIIKKSRRKKINDFILILLTF